MCFLLDSRDVIDLVEHDRPVSVPDFNAYLRAGNHEIVLSFTNVRELAGPLAVIGDFLRVRPLLQSLEQLPHRYIREAPIIAFEIQSALDAFKYRVPPDSTSDASGTPSMATLLMRSKPTVLGVSCCSMKRIPRCITVISRGARGREFRGDAGRCYLRVHDEAGSTQ